LFHQKGVGASHHFGVGEESSDEESSGAGMKYCGREKGSSAGGGTL